MEFLLLKLVQWLRLLFNPTARAADRNERGNVLSLRGDTALAIGAYSESIRLDPRAAAPFCNRAAMLYERGDYDEALADLNEAIRLDPSFAMPYVLRGHIWHDRRELDKALADYDRALELRVEEVAGTTHICRGRIWLDKGDLARAEKDIERGLFIEPRNGLGYLQRGHLRMHQLNFDGAIADYGLAVEFGRDSPDMYVLRGRAWLAKGAFDRAVVDFNHALQRGVRNSDVYEGRGTAWLFQVEYQKAIDDLNEALRLQPANWLTLNNRGCAFMNRGDFDQAAADLREAIRLQPAHPNAYKNLAWLQATCPQPGYRDGQQALANARRALELTEWKATEWFEVLAAAHAEVGDFEQAVEWQEKSLAASPVELHAEQQTRLALYCAGQSYRHRCGGN